MVTRMHQAFIKRLNYLPPERGDSDITGRVASGSIWSGLGVGANTLLQLVRSMIFARLLMPDDFGVLNLANVFTQFILIFANFGVASSVVYHKRLSKNDLSTCWWGNVFIDVMAALACMVVALISVKTSGDYAVAYVVSLLAFQFVITSLGSINMALMRRLFMFKQIAIINFSSAIATFLTGWFCVAVLGWGIYGLCAGMIAGSLIMSLMTIGLLPWLPSFIFSFSSLRKHLNYGRWFLGVNIVAYVNSNLDRVTINTLLNKTQLGFYEYASNIPLMVANNLAQVLNSVLFSAFSSLQDQPEELRQLLVKIYRYNSMIIFPFLAGIALVAPDFILVAYSEKWLPILVPLRLFCIYGILRLYAQPLQVLCNGIGKPNLPFKWSLVFLPFNLVLVYVGVSQGGTAGSVAAKMFLPLFMSVMVGRKVMQEIDLPWRRLLTATWPAISGCMAMGLSVSALGRLLQVQIDSALLRLCLLALTGVATYVGVLATFYRADLTKVLELANRFKKENT